MDEYGNFINNLTTRINQIDDILASHVDGTPYQSPEDIELCEERTKLSNELELEGLFVFEGWVHSTSDPEYTVKINQQERA